ncbi:hypothetical protein L6164_028704 [Bauhinia variegata]|uniref:Uncharacterized protein n=1 Tax=Bauhinia variegata TaxID=167791 RepID=A0ACB9L798_BAUVA|nr:hypothetical protein L6164_028704 [Bauhinia variegata]
MKPCHRIVREIQDIKSLVQGIQERRTRYDFEYHKSSSIRTQNVKWQGYHLNSHFIEEVDVVGFEGPKDEFVCWLMRGTKERDVISVKSCLVHIHELQPLPHNKAWELFCKKAFRFEFEGQCPDELVDLSNEIVQRCKGLPLAILAIGGLLSTKPKTLAEWGKLLQSLGSELGSNPHLTSLTRILALSYDDLPCNLKSCFLFFGIYPEDYFIRRMRLIRQWIAEGFVKHEEGKTLEEVADEYLRELRNRSLVHVSQNDFLFGRDKICQVHDLMREMILRKVKDLNFGCFVHGDDQSIPDRMTRRLSLATDVQAVMSVDHTSIRSIYICKPGVLLPKSYVHKLVTTFKLLKVVDFERASLDYISDNSGNLFHLRYLSLRETGVKSLPKSIGKLQNLETLDLRQTLVSELPIEINKLTKLRHLLVYHYNYKAKSTFSVVRGVQVKQGIGCLKSLQKLYHVKADLGGLELIMELRRLRLLRTLCLDGIRREYGCSLRALLEELKHLESLAIIAIAEDEIIDLQFISSPPQLQKLSLVGCLEKLPNWVIKLEYLVKLILSCSKLMDDPSKTLKTLPNLWSLSLSDNAFDGESLYFQRGFQKLKFLHLRMLKRLTSIIIERGALPVLEEFTIWSILQLKEVPSGMQYLEELRIMELLDMPTEFIQSIDPDGGQMYWTIKHVPSIKIYDKVGPNLYDLKIRMLSMEL